MKKIISLLLAICLVFSLACVAFAAPANTAVADKLNKLGLFRGTNNGYELEKSVTRTQGVVMIIRLLGKEAEAKDGSFKHPFTDLKNYPWADGYVGYAYENGITKGVGDTKFGYANTMTEAMFLTMLLRVLGYDDAKGDFVWSNPFELAQNAGLVSDKRPEKFLRDDMVLACWNALGATIKGENVVLAKKLIDAGVFTEKDYTDLGGNLIAKTVEIPEPQTPSGGGTSGGSVIPTPPTPADKKVTALTLSETQVYLYIGRTQKLVCTITPSDATDKTLTWKSSSPDVVSVQSGTITAIKEGTATITVTAASGVSATCTVTVKTEPAKDPNETPRVPLS